MKRLLVLNFFPAFVPPSSGGEMRYFNLYSKLSASFDITLLSPTFSDRSFEVVAHSDTFREWRVPKEDAVHGRLHMELDREELCSEVSALACAMSAAYPNGYHKRYFDLYERADVIIHESPYMLEYDLLWGLDDKPRVYNSYNVEYLLLRQLYHGKKADTYLTYIFDLERRMATEADLVFAVSQEEKTSFIELYRAREDRIALAPNGIDAPETIPERERESTSALFIGSQHPPNIEAVSFLIEEVAPKCPGVNFLIAGSCGDSFRYRSLGRNVRLLGRVDDRTKRDLLVSAGIALCPLFSGAGTNLKTLEYLSFGIPLISTDVGMRGLAFSDGEHFVRATRETFADKVREVISNRERGKTIARAGRIRVAREYSWTSIAATVADKLNEISLYRQRSRKRILVLNDFGVSKPSGGGEIRMNRLYSALSRRCDVMLLCLNNAASLSRRQIAAAFTELSFPKTPEHLAEEERLEMAFWVSASDIVSSKLCSENEVYCAAVKASYRAADVVVLVHPYMLPALKGLQGKPVIYESLNFEVALKRDMLEGHPSFDTLLQQVEYVEKASCQRSDQVFGVAEDDLERLVGFSGISADCAHLIRNGVDVPGDTFFSDTFRAVKDMLRGAPAILFIGSGHKPNITAVDFIVHRLAPALTQCRFLIVGTVCSAFGGVSVPKNVLLFGKVSEEQKGVILRIADLAINPMSEGSGSNLKLAEYMAHRLPTVTTAVGARGYEVRDGREVVIAELEEFGDAVERLCCNEQERRVLAEQGYAYASRSLSWKTLSDEYFYLVDRMLSTAQKGRKRLLVLTYRFTTPPLGGAEVYLLELLREIDRLGEFSITVCTLDIQDIRNRFHFSSEYTHDSRLPYLPDMVNTVVYKFACDRTSDEELMNNARRLWEQWLDESVALSLRHLHRYPGPMLMGGWYYPESSNGTLHIWSGPRALIYTGGAEEVRLEGYHPFGESLSIFSDERVLCAKEVHGAFSLSVKTQGARWMDLRVSPFTVNDDPRPLGVRVSGITCLCEGTWIGLDLAAAFSDFLRKEHLETYVEELVSAAEARPGEIDDLFQGTRGPVSVALCSWLDKYAGDYDIIMGHSVPFSTSVLAARYAMMHAKPFVILPHFHVDDSFYHWKSYYEAIRRATAVFASPRLSLDLFFSKIGARAVYLPGGVDSREFSHIDSSAFRQIYGAADRPFFLVIGRKAAAKNYAWIIEAVQQVREKNAQCSLVMIGRDEDGVPVDPAAATYLGDQPREVVLGALTDCVGLITMSESESFGLVILEAWMVKKPVIVNSRCGAFTELVEDGIDGLLADRKSLVEKIDVLLRSPRLGEEMGNQGFRKVAAGFTWEAIGREANGLLSRAVSTGPRNSFLQRTDTLSP